MLYILNSPILTEYGEYRFSRIDIADAVALMQQHQWMSAVGHDGTAAVMTRLTGIDIPVNRVAIKMEPGDLAVVFRLTERLPEGKILTEEELDSVNYELALMERTG